jgi:plasmid stabilization system protein ParE
MQISFNPLAERELNDAAQYYELERRGLGAAFLSEVEHSCKSITEYPEAAPVIVNAVRRRLLRRFPYALLYSVRPDAIRILAVMNLKRRPAYWIGRS